MEKTTIIKTSFYGTICAMGGVLGNLFGGFDTVFKALIICMIIDYFSRILVAVAFQVDIVLNSNFIRNAVILGFIANEILSIMENGGLMGIPMSPVLVNAIDILKQKSEESK